MKCKMVSSKLIVSTEFFNSDTLYRSSPWTFQNTLYMCLIYLFAVCGSWRLLAQESETSNQETAKQRLENALQNEDGVNDKTKQALRDFINGFQNTDSAIKPSVPTPPPQRKR